MITEETHDNAETLLDSLEHKDNNEPATENKTVKELEALNAEAQKQISRQGNEIGELRKLTSEILEKQLQDSTPTKSAPEPDWDYDVKSATEQLVNSKVDAIEARLEEDTRQRSLTEFQTKHPNYREDSSSEEFNTWVQESQFRSRMFHAGNAGDLQAADELLTDWEKENKGTEKDDKKSKRNQALKDAKMESGGEAPSNKKIYSRRDIVALRLNDPKAFEMRRAEISLAYKEGRVR